MRQFTKNETFLRDKYCKTVLAYQKLGVRYVTAAILALTFTILVISYFLHHLVDLSTSTNPAPGSRFPWRSILNHLPILSRHSIQSIIVPTRNSLIVRFQFYPSYSVRHSPSLVLIPSLVQHLVTTTCLLPSLADYIACQGKPYLSCALTEIPIER